MMHSPVAFVLILVAVAHATPRDRLGYEREIISTNHSPKLVGYILSDDYITAQKNRGMLETKLRPDEAVAADNVILESNSVRIVKPVRRKLEDQDLVRKRRGYNLENVWVPARYPYLPVPRYTRFRRRGY